MHSFIKKLSDFHLVPSLPVPVPVTAQEGSRDDAASLNRKTAVAKQQRGEGGGRFSACKKTITQTRSSFHGRDTSETGKTKRKLSVTS